MKLDGVHHIGVNVSNLDRAESFYINILGFKVIDRYQEEIRHSMLDTGATKIHLFESPDLEFDDAITRLSEEGYAHMAFGINRKQFPQVMAGIFSEIIDEILLVFTHMHSLYCQPYNGKYVILKK